MGLLLKKKFRKTNAVCYVGEIAYRVEVSINRHTLTYYKDRRMSVVDFLRGGGTLSVELNFIPIFSDEGKTANYESAVISSADYNFEHRRSKHFLKSKWMSPSHTLQIARHWAFDSITRQTERLWKTRGLSRRIKDYVNSVKSAILSTVVAADDEPIFSRLVNLAASCDHVKAVLGRAKLAVGGKDDDIRVQKREGTRPVSWRTWPDGSMTMTSYPERPTPRYMRYNKDGPTLCYTDKMADGVFHDVFFRDIDVSDDGKIWFHLLGSWCYKDLPQYVTPYREKEGKTEGGAPW